MANFAKAKPFVAVLFMQITFAIMNVITKTAMDNGLSNYVFVVYRHATAFLVITPFALYFEWNQTPKMTISIFWKILVLSLLEPAIDQNLYFLGMKYTTATFATAMSNMLPAITFVMAALLRLEEVNVRNRRSQAKILGTVSTVLGAMVMTLVKGPVLFGTVGSGSEHEATHMMIGAVFITVGCLCWASFMILQGITVDAYSKPLSLTTLICLFGTIEGAAVAFVMERDGTSIWNIFRWDTKLLSAVYTGIFCSGLGYYLQGVVMKTRDAVFVTSFMPLCMVIVAVSEYFLLDSKMFLGSLAGACIICTGLYLVTWGKGKEQKNNPTE